MKKLNWDLMQMTKHNCDGSYATRADRWHSLDLMGRQLETLGFKNMRATSLKPRHVEALVNEWRSQNITVATIKNRLAHLRWWAERIGNPSIVPGNNKALGIPNRCYVTNESKAQTLVANSLTAVEDPYVRMSLELQAAFGLRRAESIKFQPSFADHRTELHIKHTWAKGGRERKIPICTAAQREVLDRAHALAGKGSLIPAHKSYAQQLGVYERATTRAKLHSMHGLRHAYAQARYQELTGWAAPAVGGPKADELTPAQRDLDREVRLQISEELGHGRSQISAIYLGR